MGWCFLDEVSPYVQSVLSAFSSQTALVPSIWPLEVANVLVVGERRGRLTNAERLRFLTILRALPIEVETSTKEHVLGAVLNVAKDNNLSAYDASYLELAMREGVPLATLDEKLLTAAKELGVKSFQSE